MSFPSQRPRRLRQTGEMRSLVRETALRVDDFIHPLFVCPGRGVREEISSMPGQFRMSADVLVEECRSIADLGIPGVILFGIPETKDDRATSAYDQGGVVQRAVSAVKGQVDGLLVITDVCLCEYMSHGHCGVVGAGGNVLNDDTLDLLSRQALSHARAGADMVAPSDMMDGRVGAIRRALDEDEFQNVPIMSYAAKYASAFYGPFRDAADSAPQFGDRSTYQMDPANGDEALREIALDVEEGADIVMVKPALAYLDVIRRAKSTFNLPIAAYNVSGEYACICAAGERGWIDQERAMMEVLLSIKRAGADIILTYFAKRAAGVLAR
jgi:porphobilinogen synthase